MRTLLLAGLLIPLSLFAQTPNFQASTFHAEAGFSWPDVAPVNELLQNPDSCSLNNCYGVFPNSLFSLGLGFERVNGRMVVQGDAYVYAISNPGGRFEAFRLNILQYYYGTLKLGYVAFGKMDGDYPFIVYPYVGAGGGIGQLRLSNDGTDRFFRFSTLGYMLDAGIRLNSYNQLRGESGQWVKFGGSIGYYLAPASAWSLDDLTPGGPVPISPQGVYVRLSLGIGSVRN